VTESEDGKPNDRIAGGWTESGGYTLNAVESRTSKLQGRREVCNAERTGRREMGYRRIHQSRAEGGGARVREEKRKLGARLRGGVGTRFGEGKKEERNQEIVCNGGEYASSCRQHVEEEAGEKLPLATRRIVRND